MALNIHFSLCGGPGEYGKGPCRAVMNALQLFKLDSHLMSWLRRGTHEGKEGESLAFNCLGLLTLVVWTIHIKGYLLTINLVTFTGYVYLYGLIYWLISGLLYESASGLAWGPHYAYYFAFYLLISTS